MSTRPSINYSRIGELAEPPVIAALMGQALADPDILSLAAGFTDNLVLPDQLVQKSYQQLQQSSDNKEYLQYGTNQGRPGLRNHALGIVSSHPDENLEALTADNVIITNGSQQALYICTQMLCDPGDIILVQRPSYFVYLELLKGLGINALSIPADTAGNIDVDAFSSLLQSLKASGDIKRVKGVYLVNYYANPSSRCMPLTQKIQLANLLQEHMDPVPILEDAAYREIYFDQPWPAPGILSLQEFTPFPCLYFGTFTKPFSTGLKIGFCISNDSSMTEKMLCIKAHHDFGSANFNQAIIENMLTQGDYNQHLNSIRAHYKAKAELMHQALGATDLRQKGWEWDKPEGGLLFWLKGPEGTDSCMKSALCKRCIASGVIYVPGNLSFGDKPELNYIRLSFGAIKEDRLKKAVDRFAAAAIG